MKGMYVSNTTQKDILSIGEVYLTRVWPLIKEYNVLTCRGEAREMNVPDFISFLSFNFLLESSTSQTHWKHKKQDGEGWKIDHYSQQKTYPVSWTSGLACLKSQLCMSSETRFFLSLLLPTVMLLFCSYYSLWSQSCWADLAL